MSDLLPLPQIPALQDGALQHVLVQMRSMLILMNARIQRLGCGLEWEEGNLVINVDGETIVCVDGVLQAVAVNDGAIGGTTSYDTARLSAAA
jgi:hypothetical protein